MIKAPFLYCWFSDFPRVEPGQGTELPGDLETGVGGVEGGQKAGHLLAFLLWLELAPLHRSLPHPGLLVLLTDQGPLLHTAAPGDAEVAGPGITESDWRVSGVVPL